MSTGGYYGFWAAYTHRQSLLGAIGNGGWIDYALMRNWMSIADVGEYATSLSRTFAWRFSYDPIKQYGHLLSDLPELKRTFSLIDTGHADDNSAALLLVDGSNDTIFPIEDTTVLPEHRGPKSARIVAGADNPGEPAATPLIFQWIADLLTDRTR